MSESVKILIEAENKASAVIDSTAKDINAKVQAIKASGEQAKKSTEFFGTIANTLGGTEIGAFASQLAGVTDKTSQFAEVQKLGGAGALAFKGGLVAAVGVMAFQFGQAIGNAIFQTERWKKAMADAKEEAKRLETQLIAVKAQRFGEEKADIELIQDPDAKKAAYAELFKATGKEIEGVERRINETKKAVDAYNASYTPSWIQGNNEAAEEKLKTDREALAVLVKNREETRGEVLDKKERNAELGRSGPLMKSLQEELATITATQADISKKGIFVGETAGIDALREEIKLLEEKKNIASFEEKAKQGRLGEETAATTQLMIQVELAKKKADLAKEEVAQKTKSKDFINSLQKELASADAARIDASRARTNFTGPNAGIESLREEIKLLEDKQNIYGLTEKAKLGTVDADQKEAETLLLKIALSEKHLELGNAEQEQAKRIADIKASELQKLEEQLVLQTKGKQAAYAFSLEKQGLSKQDAALIASRQPKQIAEKPVLQGLESRLLTRGDSSQDFARNTAQGVQDTVKVLEQLRKDMLSDRKSSTTIKVIGGK